ncbi:hypothetical protein IB245_15720 [Pseudomonas sp. PDM02]|uniref:hypothetical protein n=1 Tax=Pseudomonas sp. PDM02 TaxID=2769267 RepID=UPI00177DA3DD|nr:hypothetical protein [Pseudomonas sp. PDM02]MBD9612944.1 hypothetical protein [Pseudomonas sp. PDM02]
MIDYTGDQMEDLMQCLSNCGKDCLPFLQLIAMQAADGHGRLGHCFAQWSPKQRRQSGGYASQKSLNEHAQKSRRNDGCFVSLSSNQRRVNNTPDSMW